MQSPIFIDVPKHFSFKATVYSHGWCELAPFSLDKENWRLSYVFRNEANAAIPVVISEGNGRIRIDLAEPAADAAWVVRCTRHLLRLDDDLGGLYEVITGHDRLQWVLERRAGRLLRSATVFEDLVKTICTTNCSWAVSYTHLTLPTICSV